MPDHFYRVHLHADGDSVDAHGLVLLQPLLVDRRRRIALDGRLCSGWEIG